MINSNKYKHLLCPLCDGEFSLSAKTLICAENHAFDLAKEGYVNLLPVNQKNSLAPGDSEQMVSARRQFLSSGYYDPLAQALHEVLGKISPATLLDSGCGNGYFHSFFPASISHIYGLDISKFAVKAAAKIQPANTYVVASSKKIPIRDASMNAVLSMLAPVNADELLRLLDDEGLWIEVTPGSKHLLQLRKLLFDRTHVKSDQPGTRNCFQLINENRLTYDQTVQGDHLQSLVQMTPLYWKSSAAAKANLALVQQLEITADFIIRLFKKQPSSTIP